MNAVCLTVSIKIRGDVLAPSICTKLLNASTSDSFYQSLKYLELRESFRLVTKEEHPTLAAVVINEGDEVGVA